MTVRPAWPPRLHQQCASSFSFSAIVLRFSLCHLLPPFSPAVTVPGHVQAVKTAYSDLERRFVGRLQKEGRLHPRPLPDPAASSTPGICLYEFVRDKWTFHGKGVFLERRYYLAGGDDSSGGSGRSSGGGTSAARGAGGSELAAAGTPGTVQPQPANGDIYEHMDSMRAGTAGAAPSALESHPLIVAPGLASGAATSGTMASAATKVSGGAMEASAISAQSAPSAISASDSAAAAVAAAIGGAGAGGAGGLIPDMRSGAPLHPQPFAVAMLTSVGSSNFGERSEHRDLELQLDMVTSNAACVRRLQLERDALFAPDMATRHALIRALHESYPRDPAVLELMSGGGDGSGGVDAPGAGGSAPGSDAPPNAQQAHVTAAMPELWQHGKRKIPFYMLPVTMMARSLKGYL